MHIIESETGNSAQDMHEYFRRKFLRTWITVCDEEVEIAKSTTALDTVGMEDYLSQIRQFASMELSIYIPLPNEADITPR